MFFCSKIVQKFQKFKFKIHKDVQKFLMIKFLKLSDEPKLSPDKPIVLSDRKCNLSNSVTNSFAIDSVFYEFHF